MAGRKMMRYDVAADVLKFGVEMTLRVVLTRIFGCAAFARNMEATMTAKALAIGLILAGLLGFGTSTASAQATRTWVSGVGDDANPCSRTSPCKTFAGAISKTAASGEINVLDPGGFGAVTITKSISIIADHVEGGVLVSGTNGIVINTLSTDRVLLEGLDIDGLGTGINGVDILGGGTTTIRRSSIRHFAGNGVNLIGTQAARVVIEDCIITNNAGGFNIQGASGAFNSGIASRVVFDNNTSFSTQIAGPGTLILSGSSLLGSATAINATGGATVISYTNNVIRGAGLPTQSLPLQ
jgi:hypothetical protein